MCDRHPKWQQVPPGTVIPAGQPYRVEYVRPGEKFSAGTLAQEGIPGEPYLVPDYTGSGSWFVDSSWRPPQCGAVHATNDSVIPCQLEPSHDGDHYSTSGCAGGGFKWSDRPPLELPTEPTLGLVIAANCKPQLGRWKRDGGKLRAHEPWPLPLVSPFACSEVLDFIPLTDEQVARIEQAR